MVKKRRKAAEDRRDANIHIRLNERQKEAIEALASRHGLGVSSWLLMIALREVEDRRDANIHIRLDERQKEAIEALASRHGLSVSSWLLMIALREVERAAKETGG